METDKPIWSWVNREVFLIGAVIAAVLAIYVPISDLNKEVALQNQKLDTLISWTKEHETATSKMKEELNGTFAIIFEKLGSRYIPKN